MNELQAAQEKLDKLQNELAAQQKIVDELKKGNEWPKDYIDAIRSKIYDKEEWLTIEMRPLNREQSKSLRATVKLWDVIVAIENDLTWVERANKGERYVVAYDNFNEKFIILFKSAAVDTYGIEFSLSTQEKAEHLITYFRGLLKQAMMI